MAANFTVWRGVRAAEGARLESVCILWVPWVQIPPSPLFGRETWGSSSDGRALPSHGRGRRFESALLH